MVPSRLHWAALLLLIALQVAFGAFRINPVDVPEHLAVGRILWEQGAPMVTNQISWTHPQHPNDQQYPLYQLTLHLMSTHLGFWSLSVFCCVSWGAAVLLWGRWAGGWAQAAVHAPLWLLGVVGVQRHLVPRPEVATLVGMGALLVAFDAWRARPRWAPLAAMVGTLWLMVQSHQMYLFGFLLVIGFVLHLAVTRVVAGRGWVDDRDAALPLAPLALTAVACFLVIAASPLGWRAWVAPWAMFTTVGALGASGGAEADELLPIWVEPIGGPLTALLIGLAGFAGWRARGRWQLVEVGALLMGLAMVLAAMRGIPFFALAAAAVISRWWRRADPFMPDAHLLRATATLLTLILGGAMLARTVAPRPHEYFGAAQQGLGRSIGEWADEATAFLRADPPPGEMLNIGWVAGNYLHYGVYPVRRAFVDARWEAYPKDFLAAAIAAQRDQAALDALIDQWQPGFVVAEVRDRDQQDRVATLVARGWALVYADSQLAVVVRPTDASRAYIEAHRLDLSALRPADATPEHPVLYAQQLARFAGLLRRLGETERAEALRAEAAAVDHPAVAKHLHGYR